MLFPIGNKTEFEKAYIEAAGRALCIAQNFEANCRALAILLDVREFHKNTAEQGEFSELIEKLLKRMLSGSIKQLGRYLPIQGDIEKTLAEGKDARNYIAHDSMKTLFDDCDIEKRLPGELCILRDKVRKLAVADRMVAEWSFGISRGEVIASEDYADKVEKWVFSEFSPEDFESIG